jgi:hypothetical protein
MAAFVDRRDLVSLLRRKDQPKEVDSEIDIGPLVERKRGFRTKGRIPYSGGLGGIQMMADEEVLGNGKGFVWDGRRALGINEDAEMTNTPAGVGDSSEFGQHPLLYCSLAPFTKSILAGQRSNISIDDPSSSLKSTKGYPRIRSSSI